MNQPQDYVLLAPACSAPRESPASTGSTTLVSHHVEETPVHRAGIFAISWLTYVAFYLCRQNLSVILSVFAHDHLYTTLQSARLVLAFSLAYCIGQFIMGGLVDRYGARRILVAGMVLSAFATAAMGWSGHYGVMLACQIINGTAQAAGWTGLMKLIKRYPMRKRGVVMGWWSTNYVVGGFAATLLATYALAGPWMVNTGWRRAAWLPAFVLLSYAVVFYCTTRSLAAAAELPGEVSDKPGMRWLEVCRVALSSGRIRVLMAAYFLVKLVRYSLLFWLPLFLSNQLGILPVQAGHAASWLGAYGVIGVLGAAYLSDYVFKSRRFPVAMLMMLLLSVVCIAASQLSSGVANWRVLLVVALLGCATYGADTLLVGAAAQDATGVAHMGTVSGIIDGAGSGGEVLSPIFVSLIARLWGWPGVFQCLGAIALLCTIVLALGLTTERTTATA
jgi:MFS transporter, OPA family, sugar phosphate sensor protein UhpC